MDRAWTLERTWNGADLSNGWSCELCEYGYSCTIQCVKKQNCDTWTLSVHPEEHCAYSLLVDVALSVGAFHFKVFRDLWYASSVVLQEETRSGSRVDVTFRLRIIETLSPQDLTGQTPYRDFEIQCQERTWFIDVTYLASLGGTLFPGWCEMRSKGIKTCEVNDMSTYELDCLIDATAKYRQIVVTRCLFR
ncbi:unnamed protein product [Gongylonema pulchrum]|uniref:C2 domain-containing protein n=1 Tax=Gongylonema pulchrum TaxID=637853 RepID=A0A183D8A3_9BILA|nr:unnamed protein product [Gongylonema pulchrum]